MDHVANVLGVVALAVTDRVREATEAAADAGGGAAAALVHLENAAGESVGALGQVLGLSQPGAVRLVDRLVEMGLVVRSAPAAGADRRSVALGLTAAGQARVARVHAARAEAIRQVLAQLDPSAVARLSPLLDELARVLPAPGRQEPPSRNEVMRLCRLCDRPACRQTPGCPHDGPSR